MQCNLKNIQESPNDKIVFLKIISYDFKDLSCQIKPTKTNN